MHHLVAAKEYLYLNYLEALKNLGHNVDVISGPPYPNLEDDIDLIKSPGLDLFSTFDFKKRLKNFFRKKRINLLMIGLNLFRHCLGGFPELKTFGNRASHLLRQLLMML